MVKKKEENLNQTLYRSDTNKVIAGICGGVGEFFNIDPTIIRLIFVVITMLGGSGVLIYLILWFIMPTHQMGAVINQESIKKNAEEVKGEVKVMAQNVQNYTQKHNSKNVFGLILIVLGIFWLSDTLGFFKFFNLARFWPLILVAFGIYLLNKKDE